MCVCVRLCLCALIFVVCCVCDLFLLLFRVRIRFNPVSTPFRCGLTRSTNSNIGSAQSITEAAWDSRQTASPMHRGKVPPLQRGRMAGPAERESKQKG